MYKQGAPEHLTKFNTERPILAFCTKVYDGDTAHFVFDMLDVFYSKAENKDFKRPDHKWLVKMSCRFYGYDTAEMTSKCEDMSVLAEEAKKALADLILDKYCMINILGTDKYGRMLVAVNIEDTDVNEYMASKHGVRYYGYGAKMAEQLKN